MPLPPVYVELRDRVRIHIKQIRKSRKKYPEYTIASLIAVASEALSRLQGQKRHAVFAREVLGRRHGVEERIGRALFEAVRHGLAHRYDTSLIAGGKHDIAVVIAWQKPYLHLQVVEEDWLGDGVHRPGIYLDVGTMWLDLDAFLRRLTARLNAEKKLSRRFIQCGRQLAQRYTVRRDGDESLAEWNQMWTDFTEQRLAASGPGR